MWLDINDPESPPSSPFSTNQARASRTPSSLTDRRAVAFRLIEESNQPGGPTVGSPDFAGEPNVLDRPHGRIGQRIKAKRSLAVSKSNQ